MYFRHISANIQPKNLNLHYWFLAVRGNIRLGGGPSDPTLGYALAYK